nr:MAG TPA: Protein of unknown function (DUF1056) [Caudoviricetes sp.]
MRYIDDVLCSAGMLLISAAAFGVDWRLGLAVLGAACVVAGIAVGKYFAAFGHGKDRRRHDR